MGHSIFRFGDHIEKALSLVGVTRECVREWTKGKGGCDCEKRKAKLNAFGAWVEGVLGLGKSELSDAEKEDAKKKLDETMKRIE